MLKPASPSVGKRRDVGSAKPNVVRVNVDVISRPTVLILIRFIERGGLPKSPTLLTLMTKLIHAPALLPHIVATVEKMPPKSRARLLNHFQRDSEECDFDQCQVTFLGFVVSGRDSAEIF